MGLNPAGGSKHNKRQTSKVPDHLGENEDLTIVIHHSGLSFAAVHREADDLHLHEGVDDLAQRWSRGERPVEILLDAVSFKGKCV